MRCANRTCTQNNEINRLYILFLLSEHPDFFPLLRKSLSLLISSPTEYRSSHLPVYRDNKMHGLLFNIKCKILFTNPE